MIAIVARFGEIDQFDKADLQEAVDWLNALEDDGEGYALGIYDPLSRIMYVADNMRTLGGGDDEEIFIQKLDDLKKLGFDILKIDFYPASA